MARLVDVVGFFWWLKGLGVHRHLSVGFLGVRVRAQGVWRFLSCLGPYVFSDVTSGPSGFRGVPTLCIYHLNPRPKIPHSKSHPSRNPKP